MGELDPLGILYTACAPLAFRRARRLLDDENEAWDVVHEVFERMAHHPAAVRAEAHPMAYIYKATVNTCINRWKQRRVRSVGLATATGVCFRTIEEGTASASEARDLLAALWERLDDTGRAVLVLRYVDGLPQEEVAEVIGIWRRTVGRRLSQIRELAADLAAAPEAT